MDWELIMKYSFTGSFCTDLPVLFELDKSGTKMINLHWINIHTRHPPFTYSGVSISARIITNKAASRMLYRPWLHRAVDHGNTAPVHLKHHNTQHSDTLLLILKACQVPTHPHWVGDTCLHVNQINQSINIRLLWHDKMKANKLEIVPERVLVLFRPGTTLFRFGLETFFVPELDLAKHFR